MRFRYLVLLLALAFAAGACASASQLARRSAVALQGGDPRKAYEWAKKSLDKDPGNVQARAAMHEAVQLLAGDWKTRIRNLAMDDTVNAARQLPAFSDFRDEAGAYRVPMDADTVWAAEERQLKKSAGRQLFEDGENALEHDRPKKAYALFTESATFDSRRAELDDRITESLDQARTRVAILPFENETNKSGLAGELTTSWEDKIVGRVHPPEFRFTQLVAPAEVRNAMEHTRHLTRTDAIRIGRRLGAQQVLWGRVYGLETDTHTNTFRDFIYRRSSMKDTSGKTIEYYDPVPFEAISREREVSVSVEMELISLDAGQTLFEQDANRTHHARTAYSSFQAQGSCDDYVLVPKFAGPRYDLQRAKQSEQAWKSDMPGDVKLSAFLDKARKERGRREYEPQYREWFYPNAQPWVFLDDLPPAGDLAFAALVEEWKPMFETLKRLEPLDEVDAGPPQ